MANGKKTAPKGDAANQHGGEAGKAVDNHAGKQKTSRKPKLEKVLTEMFSALVETGQTPEEGPDASAGPKTRKSSRRWSALRKKHCPLKDLDVKLTEILRKRGSEIEKKELSDMLANVHIPDPISATNSKGKPTFECAFEGCKKRCLRKADYKKHYRTHLDIRPYKCRAAENCEEHFKDTSTRCKHERTHATEAFTCPDCSKVFTRKDNMKTHQKKLHKRTSLDMQQLDDVKPTYTYPVSPMATLRPSKAISLPALDDFDLDSVDYKEMTWADLKKVAGAAPDLLPNVSMALPELESTFGPTMDSSNPVQALLQGTGLEVLRENPQVMAAFSNPNPVQRTASYEQVYNDVAGNL